MSILMTDYCWKFRLLSITSHSISLSVNQDASRWITVTKQASTETTASRHQTACRFLWKSAGKITTEDWFIQSRLSFPSCQWGDWRWEGYQYWFHFARLISFSITEWLSRMTLGQLHLSSNADPSCPEGGLVLLEPHSHGICLLCGLLKSVVLKQYM